MAIPWTPEQERVPKQIDKKFRGKGGLISWKKAYAFNPEWRWALASLTDFRKRQCLRSIRRAQGKKKLSTDGRDKGSHGYRTHPNIEQEIKQTLMQIEEVRLAIRMAAQIQRREKRKLTLVKDKLRYLQNLKSNRKSL